MVNKYSGLFRGPIDHDASSVINAVAADFIITGESVELSTTTPPPSELLPRVESHGGTGFYGVAVGGDLDGIYAFSDSSQPDNEAAVAGQAVVVVTQGRCLALVEAPVTNIVPGSPLTIAGSGKTLELADDSGELVVARALQSLTTAEGVSLIAIDVQREDKLP